MYEPNREQLDLLVYTEGLPVDGHDPVDRSLGGSETAAVSMARALCKLGHNVAMAGNIREACRVDGVYFFPFREVLSYLSGRDCDVLLTCRYHALLGKPVRASLIGM